MRPYKIQIMPSIVDSGVKKWYKVVSAGTSGYMSTKCETAASKWPTELSCAPIHPPAPLHIINMLSAHTVLNHNCISVMRGVWSEIMMILCVFECLGHKQYTKKKQESCVILNKTVWILAVHRYPPGPSTVNPWSGFYTQFKLLKTLGHMLYFFDRQLLLLKTDFPHWTVKLPLWKIKKK